MKLLIKVVILFLIIFNFRVPILYNSVVIAMLLTSLYYLFVRKGLSFACFSLRYTAIILIATLSMALINLTITTMHGEASYLGLKRFLVQLLMIVAVIYAIPALTDGDEDVSFFPNSIKILCYSFGLQGVIQVAGFLFPSFGDFLFDIKQDWLKEMVLNPDKNIDRFRVLALTGSVFFELPSAYGVACIMFFRLQLMEGQSYITGWKNFAFLFFAFIGIMLSGRTGFVGLGIGLALYILFSENKISLFFRNIWKYALVLVVLVVFYTFAMTSEQKQMMEEDVFPFAFEAYYQYQETGEFRTSSMETLNERHYFKLNDETYLIGHGTYSADSKVYRQTDPGYLNSVIFGGVFYLFLLAIYQFLFFYQPMRYALKRKTRENKIDFVFFLSLFFYMFILHYKETALGTQHITETIFIYLGTTYLLTQYSKEDREVEEENLLTRSAKPMNIIKI